MDITERRHKLVRLKICAAVAGLAGLGLFSGLAAASTRQSQPRSPVPAPNAELTRLENYLGYSFWDTSSVKVPPPVSAQTPPQVSSGGS